MSAVIIRATRASATAVKTMARHQWALDHANRTIMWNARMVQRGYMSEHAAAQGNALCIADINRAMMGLAKARGRYERANLILEREKLPGD